MKKLLVTAITAAVLFGGLFAAYVWTRPEKTIALGEKIHHDDFDYSVEKVEKFKSIGSVARSISAEGTFYVVTLKVENNAIRVNHKWDISMAYVEDQAGRKYRYSPEAQKFWDETTGIQNAGPHNTPQDAAEIADILFDLPKEVQNPLFENMEGCFDRGYF